MEEETEKENLRNSLNKTKILDIKKKHLNCKIK
jgi:hypothetical protein